MKLLNKIMFILIFFSFVPFLSAQDDFESWLKGQKKEYTAFQEERDKEFHSFLKGRWKNFDIEEGKEEDKTPKPDKIPVAEEKVKKTKPINPEKIKKVKKEVVVKEVLDKKIEKPIVKKVAKVNFFGEELDFPKIDGLYSINLKSVDKDGIAAFWAEFASNDVRPVVAQLNYYKSKKRLGDWGFFLLTTEFSSSVTRDKNTASLITWGLMLKSGYDLRAGYNNGGIKLLFTSDEDLYSIPFFNLEKKRFYLYNDKSRSIKSYDAKYDGADKKIRVFSSKRPILSVKNVGKKELKFEYKEKEYRLKAYFNPFLIEYMKTLPQFSLEKYFMGEPDLLISKYLVIAVKEKTEKLSDYEKVNFILRFVQKAFPYKTDDEQFAKEKYFYPEESIYYPFSDCEDRSVLFLYLVKKVTGFDSVILDYPGHVAAAVKIPGKVKGEYVVVNKEKYYVTDPTYINADAGLIMPGYEDKKPKIIYIR